MTAPQNPNLAANLPPQGPRRVVYLEANRAPTVLDSKYRDGSFYEFNTEWRDKSIDPPNVWKLVNILSKTNAIWVLDTGGTGTLLFVDVDTATAPGVDPVTPLNGVITITGGQVATGTVGTNVIRTHTTALNQFAVEIQRTTTAASTLASLNGVAHFNSADFTVDANGFVSLLGSGAIASINVDASSFPGTDPVVPDSNGQMNVFGAQVAANSIGTAGVRTNSLAPNTYQIEVQRAAAAGSSNVANNGICSFSSSDFSVDSNGWVQSINTVTGTSVQIFSTPGAFNYVPPANLLFVDVQMCAGGGGSGGIAATSTSLAIGGGGGGGSYARFILTAAQVGAGLAGAVGAAGTAGIAGNNAGGAGGDTTLATAAPWTLTGGSGGVGGASVTAITVNAGAEGIVTQGTGTLIFAVNGQQSGNGAGRYAIELALGCAGGNSFLGLGGGYIPEAVLDNSSTGKTAQGYGSGGGGAVGLGTTPARTGIAGTPGIVIFTEFLG